MKRWWNNGIKNKRSEECPGYGWELGRIPFKRKSPTQETRKKMSESLKGKAAWNAGQTNPYSDETKQRMSDAAKARAANGIMPDNKGKKGHEPWNKGLTANDDERLVSKRKGKPCPWKQADYDIADFHGYRNTVRRLTENTYNTYKEEINPNDLPRGIAKKGSCVYQLDHIIPIMYGYKNDIPPEEIAKKENLRMITWEENLGRPKGSLEYK